MEGAEADRACRLKLLCLEYVFSRVLCRGVVCCQVLWNGHDFSSPSRWDKVFCMTVGNNQLWLDVRCAALRVVCVCFVYMFFFIGIDSANRLPDQNAAFFKWEKHAERTPFQSGFSRGGQAQLKRRDSGLTEGKSVYVCVRCGVVWCGSSPTRARVRAFAFRNMGSFFIFSPLWMHRPCSLAEVVGSPNKDFLWSFWRLSSIQS